MEPFSIIIITKNEQENLPILLESIKQQTIQPQEIIVSDAGSADKTVEIARAYGARIVNGGLPSRGRNAGAQASNTDYLLFLDSDVELIDCNFLKKAWEDFLYHGFDVATADVYPKSNKIWDKLTHKFYNKYVRIWGALHPHAPGFCIFVKKSVHNKISGFDEKICFCEDHEYAARAVKKYGARFGFITKDVCVPVSVRRMDRDGRFMIALKYILGELHFLFLGPIRDDRFKYTFGYNDKKEDK
jgi:glycosyltransferase involved in cell wall biosynthesis